MAERTPIPSFPSREKIVPQIFFTATTQPPMSTPLSTRSIIATFGTQINGERGFVTLDIGSVALLARSPVFSVPLVKSLGKSYVSRKCVRFSLTKSLT